MIKTIINQLSLNCWGENKLKINSKIPISRKMKDKEILNASFKSHVCTTTNNRVVTIITKELIQTFAKL